MLYHIHQKQRMASCPRVQALRQRRWQSTASQACSQIRLNRRGTQRAEGDLRTIFMNPQILSHGAEWMVLAHHIGGTIGAQEQ
jgi:hypothetical protein